MAGSPRIVAIARSSTGYSLDGIRCALAELFATLGFNREGTGNSGSNPLGTLIRPGARVVIKPNWVTHRNHSGAGLECLVTQTAVLDGLLHFVQRAAPSTVILGDAPIQGCDFAALRQALGLDALVERHRAAGLDVGVADFRNRSRVGARINDADTRREQSMIVDLGTASRLEPISSQSKRFRVTRYHPDRMTQAHAPGLHRYRVAREVLEADVVISVPKLKCHSKAGITGALKNLVGINGDKDFLPHHRKGGSALGGDCYEGFSLLRHASEELYDVWNRLEAYPGAARLAFLPIAAMQRAGQTFGWETSVEGAWYGNDTVWRMCLDLHHIVRYARTDGTLSREPVRTLITITDAIVAGEGNGPLAPRPVRSGFLSAGLDAAAVDWVHARLMGFRPDRIPLLREAFRADDLRPSGSAATPAEIEPRGIPGIERETDLQPFDGRRFAAPDGWRQHVEMDLAS